MPSTLEAAKDALQRVHNTLSEVGGCQPNSPESELMLVKAISELTQFVGELGSRIDRIERWLEQDGPQEATWMFRRFK